MMAGSWATSGFGMQVTSSLASVEVLSLRVAVDDCSTVPVLVPPGIFSALDTPPMRRVV